MSKLQFTLIHLIILSISFLSSCGGEKPSSNENTLSRALNVKSHSLKSKKYALLIGTDKYPNGGNEWINLNNPINDVNEIGKILKDKYDYQTNILKNPSKDDILNEIRKYRKTFSDSDSLSRLLIYIAGHGDYDPNEFDDGFLVTTDSKPKALDPNRNNYIPYATLSRNINTLPTKQIMVILDVCFGGSFDQKLPKLKGKISEHNLDAKYFLAKQKQYVSRVVITSGRMEEVSDGVAGQHSPFAKAFIKTLIDFSTKKDPWISSKDLFSAIGKSDKQLNPYYSYFGNHNLQGEFVFSTLKTKNNSEIKTTPKKNSVNDDKSGGRYDIGFGVTFISSFDVPQDYEEISTLKYTITGDFDGNQQKDSLTYEVYDLDKQQQFKDLAIKGNDTLRIDHKDVLLYIYGSNENIGQAELKRGERQNGLFHFRNLGDLDGDGGDEVGYVIDWFQASVINRYYVISYKNGRWEELYSFRIHPLFNFYSHPDKAEGIPVDDPFLLSIGKNKIKIANYDISSDDAIYDKVKEVKLGKGIKLPSRFHIIQKGDTYFSLSKNYEIELETLQRFNHHKELRIGDFVYLVNPQWTVE
ncbi:caspase family protein [Flammeovirga aprica]|uniref:LysM domain-containing protein n=1 Tax=Flammeovirga aprica JL-4 TaxID=694437 RepID=A0A7X9RWK0_9BACT|nr:caspase family protein [Flammeovirga aprica]NME70066.1 hypothetical protein [Flammeovirga aprica JL-4]